MGFASQEGKQTIGPRLSQRVGTYRAIARTSRATAAAIQHIKSKLKHWCGFPGKNSLKTAPVLEF
jgi:hypothetical protein